MRVKKANLQQKVSKRVVSVIILITLILGMAIGFVLGMKVAIDQGIEIAQKVLNIEIKPAVLQELKDRFGISSVNILVSNIDENSTMALA
jgi:predicted PurR-regulated permease PerM